MNPHRNPRPPPDEHPIGCVSLAWCLRLAWVTLSVGPVMVWGDSVKEETRFADVG